jgi:hypothetical protein
MVEADLDEDVRGVLVGSFVVQETTPRGGAVSSRPQDGHRRLCLAATEAPGVGDDETLWDFDPRLRHPAADRLPLSGYETYAFRPTGLYGLTEFVRFSPLTGIIGRPSRQRGSGLVTAKSESVGFSWDPTDLRAIF